MDGDGEEEVAAIERVVGVAGRHGRSVRYSYTADGRLKDVYDSGDRPMTAIHEAAGAALGSDYDAVDEGHHIHVEYDPTGG